MCSFKNKLDGKAESEKLTCYSKCTMRAIFIHGDSYHANFIFRHKADIIISFNTIIMLCSGLKFWEDIFPLLSLLDYILAREN